MKIFITGGSGFIGKHLSRVFLDNGQEVAGVGRSAPPGELATHPEYTYIQADTTREGPWQEAVDRADAVINLAGVTIFKRWTGKHKTEMYDSRILTTRNVVAALPEENSKILLSASAVGFYGGDREDEILTEASPPGKDFLARLAVDWEAEATAAKEKGTRVVLTRFGVVLERRGGALKQMLPVFRSFGGGPIGSGLQWFPWIHMADLTSAFQTALDDPDLAGPVNFCSPNPVRNRDFAKALGRVLNRPAFLPVPAFMLRLAMGEFSEVLVGGQRVVPQKLQQQGFEFRFPEVLDALADQTGPYVVA